MVKINKNQFYVLISGFFLMVVTWVWGNSRFQAYQENTGFGSVGRIHNSARIEQRIKTKALIPTVLFEGAATTALFFLFKNIKSK